MDLTTFTGKFGVRVETDWIGYDKAPVNCNLPAEGIIMGNFS